MDAVTLTWRWQNFLTIACMIIAIYFAVTFGSQIMMKITGSASED